MTRTPHKRKSGSGTRAAVSPAVCGPVHFIGIGGVGMSGLATILLARGVAVSGSDAAASPALERLELLGARTAVGHAAANVGAAAQVVYSSAVQDDNPELATARDQGIPCCRRGEFLAKLAQSFPVVVSVAGSHGKTTTTAMIAHILREAGLRPGFMVGGDVTGWPAPAAAGAGRILVTEVDESDGTQALMRSTCAVVTNVDDDHCWSLGGVRALERCFTTFGARAERVFTWGSAKTRRLFTAHPACRVYADGDIPAGLCLQLPGLHNRKNATLAVAAAESLGVARRTAVAALATFAGVGRRLTERFRLPQATHIVVEDYAHHPEELRASLAALREKYAEHRLVVAFQPHRYERVKRYGAAFAAVLSELADDVVVTPPFAAWLQDVDLANPRDIATAVRGRPCCFWEQSLEALATALLTSYPVAVTDGATAAPVRVLFAVIGAGDIARLVGVLRTRLTEAWQQAFSAFLVARAGAVVSRQRSWQELTSLGVGTGRPLLVEPESAARLQDVLRLCHAQGVPVLALGAGTNLVGTDTELPRALLRLVGRAFGPCQCRADGLWEVAAGLTLRRLYDVLSKARALPPAFAPLAWIPGTVGGAVRMNAGSHGVAIGDFVAEVHGFRADGEAWAGHTAAKPSRRPAHRHRVDSAIAWGYRQSDIPGDVVVTRVVLRFPPADLARALARFRETGASRRASQPAGRSAGCVFRNAGPVAAGLLLDRAGGKGRCCGGCHLSYKHANFILTDGKASERDFVALLLKVRQQVWQRFGIRLLPEVRFANPDTARQVEESLAQYRLTVLVGGMGAGRSPSRASDAVVAEALRQAGFAVTIAPMPGKRLPRLPAGTDAVITWVHGVPGDADRIRRLLQKRGIPSVDLAAVPLPAGTPAAASAWLEQCAGLVKAVMA